MRAEAALASIVLALSSCGGSDGSGATPSTTLGDGDEVTYEVGDVEPGETKIVCVGAGGVSAAAIVPEEKGNGVSGDADGPSGSASISVRMGLDGETVTASCDAG